MKKRQQPEIRPLGDITRNRTVAAQSRQDSLTVQANKNNRTASRRSRQRRLGRKQKIQIMAAIIAAFLLLLAVGAFIVWQLLLGRIHVINPALETLPSEYNVPTESLVNPVPTEEGIENILLLGVDTRDKDSIMERSDSMMILTIDQVSKKVKLTSLQRDMLVFVPGKEEPVKINSANALGGPALAMRVVNDTFRLNIEHYMVVNMRGMEQIIDLAGGVTIDVSRQELPYLNKNLNEENLMYPETEQSPKLASAGEQVLNGRQSVAYARIRKLDSDYKRMERQRIVLQALFKSFKSANLFSQLPIISEGLSLITTNMSTTKITGIIMDVLPLMNSEIDQLQIPITGYFKEGYLGSSWVNRCDYNGMIPLLQEFIFGQTYPFDPVKLVQGAPNSGTALPTSTPAKKPTKAPTATPTTAPATETAEPTTTAETTETPSTTATAEETTKHSTGKPTEETTTEPPSTSESAAAS